MDASVSSSGSVFLADSSRETLMRVTSTQGSVGGGRGCERQLMN